MSTAANPDGERGRPVLAVTGLRIDFPVDGGWQRATEDVGFALHAGEVLALVGDSGSGKTSTALAVLGLLPPHARVGGSIRVRGQEVVGAPPAVLRAVRGTDVGMVFQEPQAALNPVRTIGAQIAEVLRERDGLPPVAADRRTVELLRLVEMPDPERYRHRYPHQLSGGQQQRAMLALALSGGPAVLVADEPTTALDVTTQAEILHLLRSLAERTGTAVLLITHDMGVVADLADRVVVLADGTVAEAGRTADLFAAPRATATRTLLAAVPHLSTAPPASAVAAPPVLRATEVVVEHPGRGGLPPVRAVDGVSLTVAAGEVLGLVGESGAGKTTFGRAVVGLEPVRAGRLLVAGTELSPDVGRRGSRRRELGGTVTMVFQDPGGSLNPRWPVGQSIVEPLLLARPRRRYGRSELDRVLGALLDEVELPQTVRNRFPHELSGGQRQRVAIARALAVRPRLLVADEPTSALDVSVQAGVLDLIVRLQREHGFACLFISHDLAVVEQVAHRVAVLRRGRLVEVGARDQVLRSPREEYTRRLVAAVPVPDPAEQARRRAAAVGR